MKTVEFHFLCTVEKWIEQCKIIEEKVASLILVRRNLTHFSYRIYVKCVKSQYKIEYSKSRLYHE